MKADGVNMALPTVLVLSVGGMWQSLANNVLARSGSGVSRPGFERLLTAICEGRVGAVFAIEASCLARNGGEWHTLIEFCGLVGTVIVDEDGTQARSMEALKQKARRGELFFWVAIGLCKSGPRQNRNGSRPARA
jgi:hypothetical protein